MPQILVGDGRWGFAVRSRSVSCGERQNRDLRNALRPYSGRREILASSWKLGAI